MGTNYYYDDNKHIGKRSYIGGETYCFSFNFDFFDGTAVRSLLKMLDPIYARQHIIQVVTDESGNNMMYADFLEQIKDDEFDIIHGEFS